MLDDYAESGLPAPYVPLPPKSCDDELQPDPEEIF
jgi:hypothetical protein